MYFYDLECYTNFFYALFISADTPDEALTEYIEADKYNDVERKRVALSNLTYVDFTIFNDSITTHNDVQELVKFIDSEMNLFIGFNNDEYDNLLLDYIIINKHHYKQLTVLEINRDLKRISDTIITFKRGVYDIEPMMKTYKRKYQSWDVLNSLFETVQRKSLKQFMVLLKWHRIEDLPIEPSAIITYEQMEQLKDYCFNDVLGTKALMDKKAGELLMKEELSKEFGMYLMNSNRSKIADKLMAKFYSDATGMKYYEFKDKRTFRHKIIFKDIIPDSIHFNDPKLKAFLNHLKQIVLHVQDKFKEKVYFAGNIYMFAKGGLHTKDKPGIFTTTDKAFISDADVGSFYPWNIINEDIHPEHMNAGIFNMIARHITVGRMEAKAAGQKIKAEGLKIVANSGLFGKFGFEPGILYDLKALYATTITGQLKLLMLAERYTEIGCTVLSANTDGLVVKIPYELEQEYHRVSDEWCEYFGFTLEFSKYVKYVRTSVNNYLAIKESGSVKTKGSFLVEYDAAFQYDATSLDDDDSEEDEDTNEEMFTGELDMSKSYGMPIVVKAVNAHYTTGISVTDYINSQNDIYDYCMVQKIGGQFQPEYHYIKDGILYKELLQKDVRFYASTVGGVLIKQYKDKNKRVSLKSKQRITIFNRWHPVDDFSEYKVDKRYYIAEALKILNTVSLVRTKDMRKFTGNMFDELD